MLRITHKKLNRKYLLNRTFNLMENNISRFQLSFNSQSTTFLLAWPVSPFPWRSRQEPTGADRSRQEPTGFLLAWPVSPLKLLPGAWLPARPRLGPVTRARAGLAAGSRPRLRDFLTLLSPSTAQPALHSEAICGSIKTELQFLSYINCSYIKMG